MVLLNVSARPLAAGWIVNHCRHILNSELVAEFLERLANELRLIIVDNPSWHAKAVDYVMSDKLDHVRCLYFLQRDSLHPFGEVIGYS